MECCRFEGHTIDLRSQWCQSVHWDQFGVGVGHVAELEPGTQLGSVSTPDVQGIRCAECWGSCKGPCTGCAVSPGGLWVESGVGLYETQLWPAASALSPAYIPEALVGGLPSLTSDPA